MLWWTGPSTTPADLDERLDRHGFLLEGAVGMAADLQPPIVGPAPDATVAIEPVDDPATLTTWSRVLCDSFGAPPPFGDAFVELAFAIGLGSAIAVPALSRARQRPARGHLLAVSRRRRRRHLRRLDRARASPARRRRVAHARGDAARRARSAIASRSCHSSALGAGMYRGLGFRDVCAIGQHVWAPENFKQ